MNKKHSSHDNYIPSVILLILLIILNMMTHMQVNHLILVMTAHLLYLGGTVLLISIWGVNCYRRIVHQQIRIYMIWIAICMLLFMLLHNLRRSSVYGIEVYDRFTWYLFYIPMLMIPWLSMTASVYLGKPADYHIPIRYLTTLIPTILLLILVLTNDLHHMVFVLAGDWSISGNYSYNFGYYVIITWIFCMILFTLRNIYKVSRPLLAEKRIPIPYIIFGIIVLYVIAYITIPSYAILIGNDQKY